MPKTISLDALKNIHINVGINLQTGPSQYVPLRLQARATAYSSAVKGVEQEVDAESVPMAVRDTPLPEKTVYTGLAGGVFTGAMQDLFKQLYLQGIAVDVTI